MSARLDGKVAMVVGAGSSGPGWGNGKATSVLFAREGARVLCVDIDRDAAQATVDVIEREGGKAAVCEADASNAADMRRAVATAVEEFGRLDVLDNNFGVVTPGGVVDVSEEAWDRTFAINVKGCFLAMKHAIPAMERTGGGSIVNISSIAGIRYIAGGVSAAAYDTTKAALNHLTTTTAIEYASRRIRVNAILPGFMKTPMVEAMEADLVEGYGAADAADMWKARDAQCPIGHQGDAWDVAHAALFLASDESRYITGVALPVDGGITATCG